MLTVKEIPVMQYSEDEDQPPQPEEIPMDKQIQPEQA